LDATWDSGGGMGGGWNDSVVVGTCTQYRKYISCM
jgi:hypothetical protein